MKRILVFFLSLGILLSLPFSFEAGFAQTDDQLIVVDQANLFGNQKALVEEAAQKLINLGADVRVRTINTYSPFANLDLYEEQLEQQSPSWLGQGGERKNNLIVLIIALQERKTGLYYGVQWENVLGSKWLNIQTDIMNPRFASGDFAGGVVKGFEEIQRLIQGGGTPSTETPSGGGSSALVAIILLVIVLLVVGVILFSAFRKKFSQRKAIRQKALLAKQGAASGINELNEALQLLEVKVERMGELLPPEEFQPFKENFAKIKLLISQSSETYSQLSHSAGDPENPKLGLEELEAVRGAYQQILDNLGKARESIQEIEDKILQVQKLMEGFPGKVSEIQAAIEEVSQKQARVETLVVKAVQPGNLISQAREALEQSQALFSRKQFMEALRQAELALEKTRLASQGLDELPKRKGEAEAGISSLSARVQKVQEVIEKGRLVFEEISRKYSESSWEAIRGNGTEAENRIDWTLEALEDAQEAIHPDHQDWEKALELIKQGNSWLDEAESFMNSIFELEKNLASAQKDAPHEVEAAEVDIRKAWDYIRQYDEDIRESLEDELREAEKVLERAKEELQNTPPDFYQVCKLARQANEAADKILLQARSEHENAERLRAKFSSARRDAYSKVSLAREYIQDHYSVVSNEPRSLLNRAVEFLRQADSSSSSGADINSVIALLLQAEQEAEQAYILAKKDAERYEGSPFPSSGRSRGSDSPPVVIFPSGGSTRSTLSWGTRRSSRPGGSISRGGGGSTSWGSRGGGSTSWGSRGGSSRGGGGSTGW
ncbi:MAG: TPM domain-containing protein [Caldiserica bacterium]|jgi:uncharacterized membrane protein YgcG|nr:TPM domain-containing protein [Caldisericota bacterium]MDH7562638.1 TPM domain-containing protein [Caldisericota bacterium]